MKKNVTSGLARGNVDLGVDHVHALWEARDDCVLFCILESHPL